MAPMSYKVRHPLSLRSYIYDPILDGPSDLPRLSLQSVTGGLCDHSREPCSRERSHLSHSQLVFFFSIHSCLKPITPVSYGSGGGWVQRLFLMDLTLFLFFFLFPLKIFFFFLNL